MTTMDARKQAVISKVRVTKQLVARAQAFLYEEAPRIADQNSIAEVSLLLKAFLDHHGVQWPKEIQFVRDGDDAPILDNLAKALSLTLAGVEAVWNLIHRGQLLRVSQSFKSIPVSVTAHYPGGSNGLAFDTLRASYPVSVRRALSSDTSELLCNHDLYLHAVQVPGMAPSVEKSLREAVMCFAAELYTPAAAMLGSASEGAWEDVGYALAGAVEKTSSQKAAKLRKILSDPYSSVVCRIEGVLKLYEQKELLGDVWEDSGMKPVALKRATIWSDVVRDSRNALHPSATPRTENTREKLASLLLDAVPVLEILYGVKAAAK